jgi:hypothetical protein
MNMSKSSFTESFFFAASMVLAITLSSASAFAAVWNDDRTEVLTALTDMTEQMNKGLDSVSADNVQETFKDAALLLKRTLPSQMEMEDFKDSGCSEFKTQLSVLYQAMFDISSSMVNFNEFSFSLNVQDPGGLNLIPQIPCGMLLPVQKVSNKLGIINDDLNDALIEVVDDMALIKSLVYPSSSESSTTNVFQVFSEMPTQSGAAMLDSPAIADSCPEIKNDPDRVNKAHNAIKSVGFSAVALGVLLQTIGITAIAGPDQVDVAVWGWAGVRLKNSPLMSFGNFSHGLGDFLLAVSGAVSRTRVYCSLRDDHELLLAELSAANDDLKVGQDEIIRLLLTPQGRRFSDFCHEEECEWQDFPKK